MAFLDERLAIHTEIVYRSRVELDDRLKITTPEGVVVELVVAGIGSRFLAGMLDVFIEIALLVAVTVTFSAAGISNGFGLAFLVVLVFLILFGYQILFELFNQGRTPGKAAAGIRVVKRNGDPVDTTASLVRNLLRLIDGWMLLTAIIFPVGFISAFVTQHAQRLGDLAAGTLVIRERLQVSGRSISRAMTIAAPPNLAWDVGGISGDEVTVVTRYLERRDALPVHARMQLAGQLALRLRSRIPGVDRALTDEQLLEWVVARKQGRA